MGNFNDKEKTKKTNQVPEEPKTYNTSEEQSYARDVKNLFVNEIDSFILPFEKSKFMMSCQEQYDKEPCMKAYKDLSSFLIHLSDKSSEENSCVMTCQELFAKEPCIKACQLQSLYYKLSSIDNELKKTNRKSTGLTWVIRS